MNMGLVCHILAYIGLIWSQTDLSAWYKEVDEGRDSLYPLNVKGRYCLYLLSVEGRDPKKVLAPYLTGSKDS